MSAWQLNAYERQMQNRTGCLGSLLRRSAAAALARAGTPQAVQMLLRAFEGDRAGPVGRAALQAMRRLEAQPGIDLVCRTWANTRDPQLGALLSARRWLAVKPWEVRVLTAFQVGRTEILASDDTPVVAALAWVAADRDPKFAAAAREALRQKLDRAGVLERLCRAFVDHGYGVARDLVLERGYVPSDKSLLAQFLFLTGHWERYDLLDFDRRLLRAAYVAAGDDLRQRIRERVRAAGRTDFLSIVAGEDYRRQAADMDGGEIEVLVRTLAANQAWAALWSLVAHLPFVWSARIVEMLAQQDWQADEAEQALFAQLRDLHAQGLPGSDEEIVALFPPAVLQAQARVPGRVNDVAFSPVAPLIAVGTGVGKLALWNYQRGERERVLGGFRRSIGRVAFTGAGVPLCAERTNTVNLPCAIYVCDGQAPVPLGEHGGPVTALAVLGDSQVLSAGRDHALALWDVRNGRHVARRQLDSWARGVRVSPGGRQAVLWGEQVSLWALPDLALHRAASTRSIVACADFHTDGETVVVGFCNGEVVVYGRHPKRKDWLKPGREPLVQHQGEVKGVEVLAGPGALLTADPGGQLQFRFLDTWTPIDSVAVPGGRVSALRVSPDGSFMVLGNSEASLTFWDLRTLKMRLLLQQPLARAATDVMPVLQVMAGSTALVPAARRALDFARCLLYHRFRFDIELGDAPAIMAGEFDIEVDG